MIIDGVQISAYTGLSGRQFRGIRTLNRRHPDTLSIKTGTEIVSGMCTGQFIGIERPINIGREVKRADIVIYNTATACASNDQDNIFIIGEIKSPTIRSADGQLSSYISATTAQGGFWTNGNKIDFYRKDISTGALIPWLGIPKYS